jgi:hypothetical protein
MIAHVITEPKGSLELYVRRVVDFLWNAAMLLTLTFGVLVISAFAFGLAMNLHIISVPQQYCHYMAIDQKIEEFCKTG